MAIIKKRKKKKITSVSEDVEKSEPLCIAGGNLKWCSQGNSLVVQWLGLSALTARGPGLIPGWGTKIPQVAWYSQKMVQPL